MVINKFGLLKEKDEAEVDENLGTYYQCVGYFNRKIWKIEELHMRKNFGIRTISEDAMKALADKKAHTKMIRTCHNY